MNTRVAFIGLGIMGAPMAGHLLAGGFPLLINSRTRRKAMDLEAGGAKWVDSPSRAADADVICICVPDTPDVEQVIAAKDGLLETIRPGTIVIDHSTISPSATQRLAAELARREAKLLDAPLSGGDVGARNGTLSIMVGGDKAAFEKAQPILKCYGKTITHCGNSGAGQFTKLVNQILVSTNLVAVCEALKFARAAGLDLETTIAATGGGAAASWQLINLGPKIAKRDYVPGFMIDLLLKDLRILEESMQQTGAALKLAPVIRQLFRAAQSQGHGKDGTQAVAEVV